jgi:hypothetical protein
VKAYVAKPIDVLRLRKVINKVLRIENE